MARKSPDPHAVTLEVNSRTKGRAARIGGRARGRPTCKIEAELPEVPSGRVDRLHDAALDHGLQDGVLPRRPVSDSGGGSVSQRKLARRSGAGTQGSRADQASA